MTATSRNERLLTSIPFRCASLPTTNETTVCRRTQKDLIEAVRRKHHALRALLPEIRGPEIDWVLDLSVVQVCQCRPAVVFRNE